MFVLCDLSAVARMLWRGIGQVATHNRKARMKAIDVLYRFFDQSHFLLETLILIEKPVLRVGELHKKVGMLPRLLPQRIETLKCSIVRLSEAFISLLGRVVCCETIRPPTCGGNQVQDESYVGWHCILGPLKWEALVSQHCTP